MSRTPPGPPPPPAVTRLRVRYARRGRLRFSSHRDFQRAFERALRRAGAPVAYSAGFSPHPKISYAGAAPTGMASEAEYLEVALTRRVDPQQFRSSVDAALPAGLDLVEVTEAPDDERRVSLAEVLVASVWRVVLPGIDPLEAARAVSEFLAAPTVEVERLTREGRRRFDARGPVVRLDVLDTPEAIMSASVSDRCAILHLVVRHATPAVRPDDVLAGLRGLSGLAPTAPPEVTRLAQGLLDEESGEVSDPLVAGGLPSSDDVAGA